MLAGVCAWAAGAGAFAEVTEAERCGPGSPACAQAGSTAAGPEQGTCQVHSIGCVAAPTAGAFPDTQGNSSVSFDIYFVSLAHNLCTDRPCSTPDSVML